MRILIVLLVLVKCSFAQYGALTGNVYNKNDKSPYEFAIILIQDINKAAYTDIKGNFRIDSIASGEHVLKVTCLGCSDTVFKINIESAQTIHFNFKVPFKCNINKENKICPVCNKSDMTIPILYGLIVDTRSKRKKQKGPEFHAGGCVITGCDPNWYCKRDEKEF